MMQEEESFDHAAIERRAAELWEKRGVHNFDRRPDAPVFSIDTPPPYVSAAHLHVGHAMSYSQAEFVVRYKRMCGHNIFYPMGFDDNGLPTERYVEQTCKVDKRSVTRSSFRALCMEETARGAIVYEELWRRLGLSVDWRLRYSTIDARSQLEAQRSFIDLMKRGLIYRSNDPVLWDTHYETALAQADVEDLERTSQLHDVAFTDAEGHDLVISTTRPELIPACVALYRHPDDERYAHLDGAEAIVPLSGRRVPIRTSPRVKTEFGSGLLMVSTFGDSEDVRKWRDDKLDTRILIGRNGRMTDEAGEYAGLTVEQARKRIVADLEAAGVLRASRQIKQTVQVGERSLQPVEFVMAPQWFIRVLDLREELLKRSAQLNWHPPHMKVRLDQWIDGLKYDWNISRQRFYGVPIPVWFVEETGEVIIAEEADLPLDPTETQPPAWALERYAGLTIVPDSDVMDTWMTSSLTPQINAAWKSGDRPATPLDLPMSLRVQAFEIIRTWLFYSLAKAHLHNGALPWTDVMISGWGLNEQGKKISKRDLEPAKGGDAFNRYDPMAVLEKYGADALRYWAAGSRLGQDLRYHERDVRDGRKLVMKLWNVARFAALNGAIDDGTPAPAPETRPIEDRWILILADRLVADVTRGFEAYDYAVGREALDRFFWMAFCDNYLEMVKERLRSPERFGEPSRRAAQATIREVLRLLLSLFAPYTPFVTEDIFQRQYATAEGGVSLHETSWPNSCGLADEAVEADMRTVLAVLDAWRFVRTRERQFHDVDGVRVRVHEGSAVCKDAIARNMSTLLSALRVNAIEFSVEECGPTNIEGLELTLVEACPGQAA